ncbi:hypothetical protein FOZ63_032652, partial [Perkinsus olseni]
FADCSRSEYIVTSYCSSTAGSDGTTAARTVQETHQFQSASTGAPLTNPPWPSYYYYPPIAPHPYPMVAPPPPYMPYPGQDYAPSGVSISERAVEGVKEMSVPA